MDLNLVSMDPMCENDLCHDGNRQTLWGPVMAGDVMPEGDDEPDTSALTLKSFSILKVRRTTQSLIKKVRQIVVHVPDHWGTAEVTTIKELPDHKVCQLEKRK